ncbi:MAG: hypothetical protein JO057_15165 [Chloroflexi bacterium]|nr:hypothetical protein [Chloroflexota bacterium]
MPPPAGMTEWGGVSLMLAANDPPFESACLVAGEALRMSSGALVNCAAALPGFEHRLLRYAHGIFNEAVRTWRAMRFTGSIDAWLAVSS